ncbi:MAG: hypothetical protein QOJ99_4081 [Bryobacterales bacterium]|nr:hypothetical protein [Bryobacterales bacterium]
MTLKKSNIHGPCEGPCNEVQLSKLEACLVPATPGQGTVVPGHLDRHDEALPPDGTSVQRLAATAALTASLIRSTHNWSCVWTFSQEYVLCRLRSVPRS